MIRIRPPAVAEYFYPGDASALRHAVQGHLDAARRQPVATEHAVKALVVPHAGYVYSGPVAASAYRLCEGRRQTIARVVLLGPSHRVFLRGAGLSSAVAFSTPLGEVQIDREAYALLDGMPEVAVSDAAHAQEHSLEVHLPFLQTVLGEFMLVPIVVGQATPATIAALLERLWGAEETLVVVSSDLSHYHDYDTARRIDARTTQAIENLDGTQIGPEHACGCMPLNGLLHFARRQGMQVRTLDVRNSGDTAGPRDRVVGYGSYAFLEDHGGAV